MVLFGLLLFVGACEKDALTAHRVPGGDPQRGAALIDSYGCGSCHIVPGIREARGKVGPPLGGWPARDFIAGALPNTPDNLIRWIVNPDAVEPGTAMPDLDVSVPEARDIAAYLFSLHERGRPDKDTPR